MKTMRYEGRADTHQPADEQSEAQDVQRQRDRDEARRDEAAAQAAKQWKQSTGKGANR